ncbi:MAG: hypothetical protein DRZ76_03855, partial [Candidatus Nealsonbacteria bacterium]
MDIFKGNLFSEIVKYKRWGDDIKKTLFKNPDQWDKFQSRFNDVLMEISNNILNLEEKQFSSDETSLYRLKKIFQKRYRKY